MCPENIWYHKILCTWQHKTAPKLHWKRMGVSRNLNIFSFHFIQSFFPRRRLNHIMLMIGNQSTKACSVQQRITNLVKFQKPPYFNMAFCQFESSLEALNTCFSICTARILQLCSRKKEYIIFFLCVCVIFLYRYWFKSCDFHYTTAPPIHIKP